MSEASRLAAFLLALQNSPTQREQFREDPKGEMTRFNLNSKTINAVLKKDKRTLWRILRLPAVAHQVGWMSGVEKKSPRKKKKRT